MFYPKIIQKVDCKQTNLNLYTYISTIALSGYLFIAFGLFLYLSLFLSLSVYIYVYTHRERFSKKVFDTEVYHAQ